MAERSVLITGAHGFLGRRVARAYADRGFQVHGIGHGDWPEEEWRGWGLAAWHPAGVTPNTLCGAAAQPELVIHCAGGSSVAASIARPHEDFHRTVSATASVLEFVRTHAPAARVLFPSSGSVYGSANAPVGEDRPASPLSPYATHKRMAEELCAEYGQRFGVASVVVRFFSLYGPGLRKQLLWDACRRLLRGENAFDGTGQERRDFLHVDDAVELVAIAADRASPSSPIVNGGTGTAPTVAEVVNEVAAALSGAGLPVFTGGRRAGDPGAMVADTTRARAWGWTPRIGWRRGVQAYCAWFLAEGS